MEEEPSTSSGIKRSLPQELQDEIDKIVLKQPRTTGKTSRFRRGSEKMVGCWCMPTERNILSHQEICCSNFKKKLCYTLSIKHKLETQTFLTHLQKYPKTNKSFLNYEGVNNNKVNHGYRKAKYDYKIKSLLDFSKLFLQSHMAHYTGLDDTCDSSALLGLILNIDQFKPGVKYVADDVRQDIRNPWAHCDLTEWNTVKYLHSFRLMKNLVKDLKLRLNEESQIIGEIEKWEVNGPRFLSGTTYGFELVNEFRQQTRALAEYSQLVATETDSNFINMVNELKKLKSSSSIT
ncbi:Hypothetical predicted protein [Mytilus galloprovincialis]|uniref:Uncharacterized protein n=1 Tax=Mytilus galloprovincialis TaxID=29158 RepID=A0A8B6GWE9_MYTGA|nr:Hypothetical predicted protein [Mytilus galloprovincialis]